MSAKIEPFVQVVEVWTPDGKCLRHRSGAYGRHTLFAEASEHLTFVSGQGLPGEAWAQRRPVVWDKLDERFLRRALAESAGLDAGVAFPVFRGEQVVAVVSMLCGSREHTGGCIEIWEPNELRELTLQSGFYGQLGAFGELSALIRFQKGRGLPGICWERGLPHIIPDLRSSAAFIRAAAARTSGVTAGLGVPLYRNAEVAQVLLLLSAHSTPLARAFEVWRVDRDGTLSLDEFFYASDLSVHTDGKTPPSAPPGQGLAMRVKETGLPFASRAPHTLQPVHGSTPARASFQLGLGLPVHDGDRIRAIVNLLS
ncbi:MAG: hypothetical protein RLZZ450_4601 [Pseudomonadota bacterium]|jgi:putative methionine-R-sulfoxide reductase with GAF domain